MYNERNSLTSRHKIIPGELTRYKNQFVTFEVCFLQMLPLWVRMDLEVMIMKFPPTPEI